MTDLTRRDVLKTAAATAIGMTVAPALAQTQPATASSGAAAPTSPLVMWYRQPASPRQWTEALPIGNGRLGAMIFGDTSRERLQLNEDTLWAGGPYDPVNPQASPEVLADIRKLIFDDKLQDALKLISDKFMAKPLSQMPYQAVGDVILELGDGDVTDYLRTLDIGRAVATVAYTRGGTRFTREMFASPVDQVIVVNLSADRAGQINFTASFESPHRVKETRTVDDKTIDLVGKNGSASGIQGKLSFVARMQIDAKGGKVSSTDGKIKVENADSATLRVAIATSFKRFDDVGGDPAAIVADVISKSAGKSFEQLRDASVAAHRELFDRVSIDLGTTADANRPTDERIKASEQSDDPALPAMYFNYARYLMICSSRPGTQPANLQGIWADGLNPPWQSKYTININTEMNYWPVEASNLAECIEPLTVMVEQLAKSGEHVAKKMYGAGGWVAHHNTDIWKAAAPIDGPLWGMWPCGGAWLCNALWDHYEYGQDRKFLERLYPVMKGAAQFFVDTLTPEPTHGWLVTCPSVSPENSHHRGMSLCAGPTMDNQIVRDLFDHVADAAETLGVDADFAKTVREKREKLPPTQIGPRGEIQEWLDPEWDATAPEQNHRHISHLYGLFPSNQIDVEKTPDLAKAAMATLNRRGDVTTGWAIAWRFNCWARLRDGERAYKILRLLLQPSRTYPNMFDAHPPFQIDGNFGGANGIAQLLMQSNRVGEIDVLPALPKAWPTGSVKGLRARGGFGIDIEWKDGELSKLTVRSAAGQKGVVRYRGREYRLLIGAGESLNITGDKI